ncbi:MAG: family 16 glycoside hydrolase [Planctomycetota bacterium]
MRSQPLLSLLLLLGACGADLPRDAQQAGWIVQHDDERVAETSGRFLLHSDGSIEVGEGPNADIWSKVDASGNYRITVDVTHLDSGLHPHGAGILFGGRDRGQPSEHYSYFLVRGDRSFLVKMRRGDATEVLVNWTEHDAVAAEDAQGVTRNRLSVEVTASEVRFSINGVQVHRMPPDGCPTDGALGYRLVHDLRVRFGPIEVEQLP